MLNFLKLSGAVAIGLAIAGAATFPILVAGAVLGWFYISENVEED